MKKAIMAKKIGMTQIFDQETGEMIPVTVLEAGPCCVTISSVALRTKIQEVA